MNFQLPKQDEDFDYYGNSSQDESRGSQGRQFGFVRKSVYVYFLFLLCLFLSGLNLNMEIRLIASSLSVIIIFTIACMACS